MLLSLTAGVGACAEDYAPLFDSGVNELTGALLGNAADLVQVDGGLLNRGKFEGKYQITLWPSDGSDREAFADDMGKPVPANGAVVYQGQTNESSYGWMVQKIGQMPVTLPLTEWDVVFYTDEQYIWYYTDYSAEEHTIGHVGYDGEHMKELGRVTGQVICMMPGDQVLLFNHAQNQVQLWKDGSYHTVYSPEEAIKSVFSLGAGIWAAFNDSFGPLSDGAMTIRFPGSIIASASSANHFALLVSPEAASNYLAVLLFNEAYQAYTTAGTIRRQEGMSVELQPNQMIVWGNEESVTYSYPGSDVWLPYGYNDLQ